MTIYENGATGLNVRGVRHRREFDGRAEKALPQAALWDEIKDRRQTPAYEPSGGQQQQHCIARVLAPEPRLLLLDEPTSALDPMATAKIEELIDVLVQDITIIIVTHNMTQAARISHQTAFMHFGNLVEFGATQQVFTRPRLPQTQAYITGLFG